MDPFVHLHVASGYSMRYGASHPHVLVARAAEHGMPALALTDHDELGGVVAFAQAGFNHGLECIIGAELTTEVPGAGCQVPGAARCEVLGAPGTQHPTPNT